MSITPFGWGGRSERPAAQRAVNARRPRSFAAALLAAGFLAAPACSMAENVAVTFDDLPLNGILPPGVTQTQVVQDVLEVLKVRRVPQVFGFVNASKLEGNPDGAEALRRWVAGGERVANHAYQHVDLHESTAAEFLQDVVRNEPALELLDPSDGWRWFRYPYLREGDTLEKRRLVRGRILERRYRIAQVTFDWEDYLWNSAYARCVARGDGRSIAWLKSSYLAVAADYIDADRQMAKLVFGHEISHVLLLHLGAFSSTILPDLFDLLRDKGLKIVTLELAQSDAAYQADPDAASPNGGTLLEQLMDARKIKYPPVTGKPFKELEAACR